ncbi:MAG: DUF924 domain-containing protein [Myxococcales bacterium]|nr:DUF924 domain-containing protein [Myxococcales bacterium]
MQRHEVLDFWFGSPRPETPEEIRRHATNVWRAGASIDDAVRERFGAAFEQAVDGALDHWCETLQGKLALLILLDQFSRHIHRDTEAQYRGDAKALQLARELHDGDEHEQLTFMERAWAMMPFAHHESIDSARRAIEIADALKAAAPPHLEAFADIGCQQSRRALAIFERFGRYPHRNAILGRQSTAEEEAFLRDYRHGPTAAVLEKAGIER